MKFRTFILGAAFVLLLAPVLHCQSDSMIHVNQFHGTTVGDKVAAAMQHCPAAPVPCILVLDGSLAAAAPGTMPALCATCSLEDYRQGAISARAQVVNIRDYGCKGDGVTDDSACLVSAGNAVVADSARGAVVFYWPRGVYLANPLKGMAPPAQGAMEGFFFSFAGNNITVEGDGAVLKMAVPSVPYNQQVGVTPSNNFSSYWFYFRGSNIDVHGLTIDDNGATEGGGNLGYCDYSTGYGCFLGQGIKARGPITPNVVSITNYASLAGLATYSWSLTSGTAPVAGESVTVAGLTGNTSTQSGEITNGTIATVTGTTSGTFTVKSDKPDQSSIAVSAVAFLGQPSGISIYGNRFFRMDGWPVNAQNVEGVVIRGNYAEKSEGMVCTDGTFGCVITGNLSVESRDAAYAVNGGTTNSQWVWNFAIAGNTASGNSNGDGIDVTAARNGTVSGNAVSDILGDCIIVDRSDGYFTTTESAVLPSIGVTVTGNHCDRSILVGDTNAQYNTGGAPINFTPGDAALRVRVSGNQIVSHDALGNGLYIGYGAKNITADENSILSMPGTCTSCGSGAQRVQIQSGSGQSDLLTLNGNSSDTAFANVIQLTGTISTLSIGNNPGFSFSGTAPTSDQGKTALFGTFQTFDHASGGFHEMFSNYAINAPGNAWVRSFIGHDASANNAASLGWYGSGTLGSTSNQACMGLFGDEQGLCVDGAGNVQVGGGGNIVYRCATAGALPVGALTITAASCGTTTDTGMRVK